MKPSDDIYTYKPFIDGLRAIAILTVVAAHVGVPGTTGGFVGVDIFFVISGYLIINLILADIRAGRYSFFAFEARRALRILPTFLLMMVVCLALGTTIFVLSEYKIFAESYFFAAIMQANHQFLSHQGYFEMAAFTQPLLHTWSLAVEEQFYLVAPLTLFGLVSWTRTLTPGAARKTWIIVTVGLTLITFGACMAFTVGVRNFSFYLMPTRGWEFILGGAAPVFALIARRLPRWTIELLAISGVTAIAIAVHNFNAETIFPSYRVALPVLGATLIIVSGLADAHNSVARALATRPMVGIGLVSYSWYLWHWPLLSFFQTTNFGRRDLHLELGVAAIALVLAMLTYRLVEVPVRKWRHNVSPRPVPVVLTGIAACLLVAFAGYGWSMYAAPHFLPTITGLDPIPVASVETPPILHRGMLLGDSHAGTFFKPLQDYARRAGAAVEFTGHIGCPPLRHVSISDHAGVRQGDCDEVYREQALVGSEFAILIARWNFYLGLPPSDLYFRSFTLTLTDEDPAAPEQAADHPYALLANGLNSMIATAKKEGVRRILVIGPVPEFFVPPLNCLMRAIRVGINICAERRATIDERRAKTMQTLHEVTSRFEGVRLIDPINVFCTTTECRPFEGRTLYFSDTNHLSPAGVDRFYRAFQNDFNWVMTGLPPISAQQ